MDIRNPAFFEAPDFWKSDWEEVNAYLDALNKGQVWEIGRSVGGRPIRAVAYGEKEPIKHTNTMSSAIHAGHLEDFFDPDQRTKPVMVIIATVHGAEVEGLVACVNFAHLMETGTDLRGRRWDELRELASNMRVVLVPIAQPDGRIRCKIRHLVGGAPEDVVYYGQGAPSDPEDPATWKWFLRWNPMPPEKVKFLGGYYNDAGVNIELEDFFSPNLAPEARALIDLVREETPECFLVLHAYGAGPAIIHPYHFISQRCQYHQAQIAAIVAERHRRENLRPGWYPVPGPAEVGYFNLQTALHHASGALPLLCELPHGLETNPFTFDEILDCGLLLFEELLRYVDNCRYIPGKPWRNSRGLREVPTVRLTK